MTTTQSMDEVDEVIAELTRLLPQLERKKRNQEAVRDDDDNRQRRQQ